MFTDPYLSGMNEPSIGDGMLHRKDRFGIQSDLGLNPISASCYRVILGKLLSPFEAQFPQI